MNWFKCYAEFATDPKVQMMPEAMQRRLIMLLCLRCSNDLGSLTDDELARTMRISAEELEETRELFRRKGFIGRTWDPTNWEKRQAPKDRTASERMHRLRAAREDVTRNVARNVARNGDPDVTAEAHGVLRAELRVEAEAEEEKNPPLPPKGKRSRPKPKPDPVEFALPDWIPRKVWDEWIGMRKRIRKPVHPESQPAVIERLAQFKDEGYDPVESLRNAIIGSYQGLFRPDDKGRPAPPAKPPEKVEYITAESYRAKLMEQQQ